MRVLLAAAALALSAAAPADFAFRGRLEQGGLVFGTAPAGTVALTLDGEPVPVAADGRFLLGFDRDAAGTVVLEARSSDGTSVRRELSVAPRAWAVQHVDMARGAAGPSESYRRLREGELARIAAARAVRSEARGWRQVFARPARGRISGPFGAQRIYRGVPAAFHAGIDIAAGAGATVTAPADGVVVLAGPPMFSLEGNLVILDHGMGLNSAFLHLSSVAVQVGQRVRQGEAIGRVGGTGRATGPHLHWAVRWNEARIDPARLVGIQP
jgi:murein DD-endopeptidase MepM/ murein hydrolase activator NlpD